jgi:integrase/recombinase XerD
MARGGVVTGARAFTSWLAPYFESFVALRRSSGAVYLSQKNLLLAFDRYVDANAPKPPLLRKQLLQYLVSLDRLSPRGWGNVVGVVWPALTYAQRHGARVEALPARPPKPAKHWRQRQPHILSTAEVGEILAAARRLPPANSLRSATTATLLGLLYTTGLRIGEALALNGGDLDRRERILIVRKGKFGKSRSLPLRKSTCEALARYVDHPLRPVGTEASAALFVSGRRRRLSYPTVWTAIQEACRASGIPRPWPRPHDFRHTFAVSHVVAWYAQGRDVDSLLPVLSTYLGHLSIENTRLYLVANGPLLEQAARRFAHQTRALDEVCS